jgi:uncharacterized radical SAM superfamily Fe-S cluster-containing enzyme
MGKNPVVSFYCHFLLSAKSYLHSHAKAKFINSICPDCAKEVNAKICAKKKEEGK